MIYILINIALCGTLIWTSFTIDVRDTLKNNNPLVNTVLCLATLFGLNTLCLIAGFWAPAQLARVLGKFRIMLVAWFSVYTCFYQLQVPNHKRSALLLTFQWALNLVALYIAFIAPGAVSDVTFTQEAGMEITSEPMFTGKMNEFMPISWFGFF